MVAGEPVPFQQGDSPALAGQHSGSSAPRRAAADDYYVSLQILAHNGYLPELGLLAPQPVQFFFQFPYPGLSLIPLCTGLIPFCPRLLQIRYVLSCRRFVKA